MREPSGHGAWGWGVTRPYMYQKHKQNSNFTRIKIKKSRDDTHMSHQSTVMTDDTEATDHSPSVKTEVNSNSEFYGLEFGMSLDRTVVLVARAVLTLVSCKAV